MTHRLSIACVAFVALSLPASAQETTGKAALKQWFQSHADVGIDVSYQAVVEDGDQLTIENLTHSFETSFDIKVPREKASTDGSEGTPQSADGTQTVTLSIRSSIPTLTLDNFEADENGFFASGVTMSDATEFSFTTTADDTPFQISGGIEGYTAKGIFWPRYPAIEDDPARPVSRWLPLIEAYLKTESDSQTIGRLFMESAPYEDADHNGTISITYDIKDIRIGEIRDGVIKRYATGPLVEKIVGKDKSGTPIDILFSIAETSIDHYDVKAILALLYPSLLETSDYVEALGSAVARDYKLNANPVKTTIDRISMDGFSVRRPDINLAEILDEAFTSDTISEESALSWILELYRALAVDRFSIEGIAASFPSTKVTGETDQVSMEQYLIRDLSADGLEELSVNGIKADIAPGGSVLLGKFAIGDINFPPVGPIRDLIAQQSNNSEPDPLVVARALTPRSFAFELGEIDVVIPDGVEMKLSSYFLGMASLIPPIPTEIEMKTDGLEIPVKYLDDEEAIKAFEAFGLTTLRWTDGLRIRWDEQTEDVFIDDLTLELGDVGRVHAKAHLGGLPRSILENPEQIQAAIATLSVKSLELELINDGGVEKALDQQAKEAGIERAQMAQGLLLVLDGLLGSIGNDAFAAKVKAAAETFFADPRNLRLRLSPDNPVPVTQIIGGVATAPQILPDILGAEIEANQ
ncbi:hypothetical protein [Coralliovum pocilloporae]|uniref:hypothetical protein n=1 Tax=Coralliovum pocilloporae TaxID=3066369 RepID=UPI0033076663